MYTLYYAPGAASLAVHWLLIELGVAHELKLVDLQAGEHRRAEYLALNPNGVVPTLIVDGAPAWECAALLMLLAERHPEPGLAPPPGGGQRVTYLTWMFHLSNTVQPAFRDWFYPDRQAGEAQAPAIKDGAQLRIEAAWDRLDAQLRQGGPYVAGDRVSAVDFLATMLLRWSRNMPRPATGWPALGDYAQRMKARPSFRALYAREGLTEWA